MLRITILVVGVLVATAHGAPAARCIPRDLSFVRGDSAGWVIAEATRDSAVGATWSVTPMREGVVPPRHDVYGQWARVIASDSLRRSRALFVHWWECGQRPAGRAIVHRPGTRFFVGAAPATSIAIARGAPVYHVTSFTRTYSPALYRNARQDSLLTLEEYARWYVALPTVDEYAAAPDRMADSIRRWSKRLGFDRRRPVRDALFALEQDLPGMRPDPQGRR